MRLDEAVSGYIMAIVDVPLLAAAAQVEHRPLPFAAHTLLTDAVWGCLHAVCWH